MHQSNSEITFGPEDMQTLSAELLGPRGPPGTVGLQAFALAAYTCGQLSALLPGRQAPEHLCHRPGSAGLSCLVRLSVSGVAPVASAALSLALSGCSAGLLAAAENFCPGFCLPVWFQHCDSLGS